MGGAMITIRSLRKSFSSSDGPKVVLDGVSFDCNKGSFTTIFGPNGCGKSTLINIIAGLDKNYEGAIHGGVPKKYELGYVFQDYRRSLLPWFSVRENILYPLRLQSISRVGQKERLDALLQKNGNNY
jgi:NitT/TauT family transport system ATP-binding protein